MQCALIGVANGKCQTLWDRKTNIFLCKPETFWLFRLRDRDFKVFRVRGRVRDVQILKIRALDLVESYENELEWACTIVLQPFIVNPCARHQIWKSVNSTCLIVNELNYFPGHDIISSLENGLGRFHLIFLTDMLSLNSSLEVSKKNAWPCFTSVEGKNHGGNRNGEKVFFFSWEAKARITLVFNECLYLSMCRQFAISLSVKLQSWPRVNYHAMVG